MSYAEVVETNFLRHNILRIGPHEFLGVAISYGEYSHQKLLAGAYPTAVIGGSPEAVKAEVAAEAVIAHLEQLSSHRVRLRSLPRAFLRLLLNASLRLCASFFPGYRHNNFPPQLAEADYFGFNILQTGPSEYTAFAQEEGEYLRYKAALRRYRRIYVADSLEGVKAAMPASEKKSFPPRLVERDYFGFNILQTGPSEYTALGQEEGAYLGDKASRGSYRRIYVADSLEGLKAALPASEKDRFIPRLVEESYRGFNILQIEKDRYLALAQSEGAFEPSKLAAGIYKQAYDGPTLEAVKRKIAGRTP